MNGCGIYQIEHLASGRKYIGSAARIAHRWTKHRTDLRSGRHHSQKLQHAWTKYGESAFEFTVLEEVSDAALLLAREQHWINESDALVAGFNICPTAGSCRGRALTDEHKAKLAAALRGRKRPPSDHASLIGKARSAETRARISAAKSGVPLTPEALAERKSRRCSPESNAKRSATLKGRARGPEIMLKAWVTRRARAEEAA